MMAKSENFWENVRQNEEGCLVWQAGVFKSGYGVCHYKGKTQRAHRVPYQLSIGDIPQGYVVMHTCNNKLCCNPAHLKVGTQSENLEQAGSEGKMTRSVGPSTRSGLSQEDIDYIKFSELSNRALARMYGFSCHKTISAIRRGYYKDARRQ